MLESGSYTEELVCRISTRGELIWKESLYQSLEFWLEYYTNLSFEQGCYFTKFQDQKLLVEFEECPLVAQHCRKSEDSLLIEVFPGLNIPVALDSLRYDDEDNFYAISEEKQIPIFFLPSAQNDFFNLCDEFSDDDFSIFGKKYELPHIYEENHSKSKEYWDGKYNSSDLGWDMGKAHPYLDTVLSQVKLMRSKILVLGAGRSHDANFFADQGHIVTAVDISQKAIDAAKEIYPETEHLKYQLCDAFKLKELGETYDLIWDHTFYCAIPPQRRTELVKLWYDLLNEQGKVSGVFFSMFKPMGPPYGGSERELNQRVSDKFHIIYWNRIRQGPVERLGKEFFVYLEKK